MINNDEIFLTKDRLLIIPSNLVMKMFNEDGHELVPVVYGEWLDKSEGYHWYGRCSVCLHELCLDGWYAENMNYCPNCGAKMSKERIDND